MRAGTGVLAAWTLQRRRCAAFARLTGSYPPGVALSAPRRLFVALRYGFRFRIVTMQYITISTAVINARNLPHCALRWLESTAHATVVQAVRQPLTGKQFGCQGRGAAIPHISPPPRSRRCDMSWQWPTGSLVRNPDSLRVRGWIRPPVQACGANQASVLRQIRTSMSMTGTSISTPTTVARAAPLERPKSMTDVAIATSK